MSLSYERLALVEISANSSHIWGRKGPGAPPLPPPKRDHFTDAALPQKHLKIYKLTTENATLMKLSTVMYLHKMFNLAEDWGVTHRA